MKKVYCKVLSLEQLKINISENKEIVCIERNAFNPNGYKTYHSIYDLEINDIVALERIDNDSNIVYPYEWVIWNGYNVTFPNI